MPRCMREGDRRPWIEARRRELLLKPQLSLRAKPQPVPANLSATFRVASIAVPASAAILRSRASTKEAQHMFSRKLTRSMAAGAAAIAVAGGSYGIVSATSSGPAAASTSPAASSSSGGSNARSGPAAGGSSGTVGSVSASGFTITTSAGQKVTVKEASSTTYQNGTSPASASAITTGEPVLVLGTVNSTTITATQVTVEPVGTGGSAASSAAGVVPFQQGAPSTSRTVGQIPADYSQGSGTIVSGTAANKATEAALAAYPGGVVDRVVLVSNGEYEVHYTEVTGGLGTETAAGLRFRVGPGGGF